MMGGWRYAQESIQYWMQDRFVEELDVRSVSWAKLLM